MTMNQNSDSALITTCVLCSNNTIKSTPGDAMNCSADPPCDGTLTVPNDNHTQCGESKPRVFEQKTTMSHIWQLKCFYPKRQMAYTCKGFLHTDQDSKKISKISKSNLRTMRSLFAIKILHRISFPN